MKIVIIKDIVDKLIKLHQSKLEKVILIYGEESEIDVSECTKHDALFDAPFYPNWGGAIGDEICFYKYKNIPIGTLKTSYFNDGCRVHTYLYSTPEERKDACNKMRRIFNKASKRKEEIS